MATKPLALLTGLLSIAAVTAAPAAAATTSPATAVSANWGGYAVTPTGASAVKHFSSVRADWVEPVATCTAGSSAFSAFWVGLGGFARSSRALEQAGTEADCSSAGQPVYYAWYELVPAAPVRLRLAIKPGDSVSTTVHVSGHTIRLKVLDRTTGTSVSRALRMSATPDTSSAEWIAEAPSACDGAGNCRPLALADFGSVTFSSATATAAGVAGVVDDPRFSVVSLQLSDDGSGLGRRRFGSFTAATEALPSALSSAGDSFSVAWQQQPAAQAPAPSGGFPGDGNPGSGPSPAANGPAPGGA